MAFSPAAALARTRAGRALSRPHNWVQLAKFSAVGASGYVINLAVYTALLRGAGLHYAAAATCSFLVAVTNNYVWNRLWTFHDQRGHAGWQGLRFLLVAVVAYGANLALLSALIGLGMDKVLAQAIAVVLVTPLNFLGNKLWSFRLVRG
jgi:putative flippase GtrA